MSGLPSILNNISSSDHGINRMSRSAYLQTKIHDNLVESLATIFFCIPV